MANYKNSMHNYKEMKLTIWHEFVRCFLEQFPCELMNDGTHMSHCSWDFLARALSPHNIHLRIRGIRESYITAFSRASKSCESQWSLVLCTSHWGGWRRVSVKLGMSWHAHLVSELRWILAHERDIRLVKISRHVNVASHTLASMGRSQQRIACLLGSSLREIASIVETECSHHAWLVKVPFSRKNLGCRGNNRAFTPWSWVTWKPILHHPNHAASLAPAKIEFNLSHHSSLFYSVATLSSLMSWFDACDVLINTWHAPQYHLAT